MDLNEMDEYFAYTKWLSDAMVDVFRKTLSSLSNKLPEDNHHLYINFLTKNTGVEIPKFLKTQYPKEMTIVLEHQFDKLVVKKNGFQVNLKFEQREYTLKIPYSAVIHFADPSVGFALQLQQPIENDGKTNFSDEKVTSIEEADERQEHQGDVIDIETFRKK
jgi:hypothetical protein